MSKFTVLPELTIVPPDPLAVRTRPDLGGREQTLPKALTLTPAQRAIAPHLKTPIDLDAAPPDAALVALLPPETCLAAGLIPWRRINDITVIAWAGDCDLEKLMPQLTRLFGRVAFGHVGLHAIQTQIAQHNVDYLSQKANVTCPPAYSCRNWADPWVRLRLPVVLIALASAAIMAPDVAVAATLIWIMLILVTTTGLRLSALVNRIRATSATDAPVTTDILAADLPVISILIPLFDEDKILRSLIERLKISHYPKSRLEVCLVLESDDHKTGAAVARIDLPDWMRVIKVPPSPIKTKPRAMNYALDFCRGSIIGIYDAEDAPDFDQLHRIAAHFASAPANVACVQGYLDFYNARRNWLARCFTIEYAIWFRVVLHGIDGLGLPVPLGGTTVFFRRQALVRLGAWDAHNVTEDADLGFRLARLGYRCDFVPTTTCEEANCTPKAWIRQRSRWLKGYAMTWNTHMQNPRQLWRDLGPGGFFAFQVLLLGTFTNFLLAPLIWALWWMTLGGHLPFVSLVPALAWTGLAAAFVGAEMVLMLLGLYAVSGKAHRHLIVFLPTMMLYWPLATIAAYKALYELIRAPFYWDKTQHGQHSPMVVQLDCTATTGAAVNTGRSNRLIRD